MTNASETRVLNENETSVLLAQHGSDLRALKDGFRETNLKLDRVFGELHGLANSLTMLSSQPNVSIGDVLDNILKIGGIAGFAVAGILYVNQAFLASDLTELRSTDGKVIERLDSQKLRIERIENLLLYKGAGLQLPMSSPEVPK